MADIVAHIVKPKGHWSGTVIDRVVLPYDDRFRRRILLTSEQGAKVLLSLREAQHLHTGDALETPDGKLVEVVAASEKLIEIRCANQTELLRVAWHLGNRHLRTQIEKDVIFIRFDQVILDMVIGLGAEAKVVHAPFNPEGGAYGGHSMVHSHEH